MKALSIRQPWAWAILNAGKDIENRVWPWNYSGDIVIHAPARMAKVERWPRGVLRPDDGVLRRSAFLGVIEIVRVVERSRSPWFEGPFGFELANPRPLAEPIEYRKGRVKPWTVDPEVARRIYRQLGIRVKSIRHFIAYHNTARMGHQLQDCEPLRLLTNKSVDQLLRNIVWFVTGEGIGIKQFSLGSVFEVSEVGKGTVSGFKRFAAGPGHVFKPAIPIKDLEWFTTVLRTTGNFAFGVREVKDDAVIDGLIRLAAQAGYMIA